MSIAITLRPDVFTSWANVGHGAGPASCHPGDYGWARNAFRMVCSSDPLDIGRTSVDAAQSTQPSASTGVAISRSAGQSRKYTSRTAASSTTRCRHRVQPVQQGLIPG